MLCCRVLPCPDEASQIVSRPRVLSLGPTSHLLATCLAAVSHGRPSTCRQTIERKNRVVASSLAGDAVELSARLERRWELYVALPPNSGGSWQPSSMLGAPRSYIGVYRELGCGRVSRGRSPESSVQRFGWSPSTTRMVFGQHRTGVTTRTYLPTSNPEPLFSISLRAYYSVHSRSFCPHPGPFESGVPSAAGLWG